MYVHREHHHNTKRKQVIFHTFLGDLATLKQCVVFLVSSVQRSLFDFCYLFFRLAILQYSYVMLYFQDINIYGILTAATVLSPLSKYPCTLIDVTISHFLTDTHGYISNCGDCYLLSPLSTLILQGILCPFLLIPWAEVFSDAQRYVVPSD